MCDNIDFVGKILANVLEAKHWRLGLKHKLALNDPTQVQSSSLSFFYFFFFWDSGLTLEPFQIISSFSLEGVWIMVGVAHFIKSWNHGVSSTRSLLHSRILSGFFFLNHCKQKISV